MVRNIAIIPARSGSKRVKDKNIHPFGGKPLIAWSIQHALESGIFEYAYVSTDSDRYSEIAASYGSFQPFLRDACADDYSTVSEVVVHELVRLENHMGVQYDNVAIIQPTCPFCTTGTIKDLYQEFLRSDACTMTSCFPFSYGNPWWAFRKTEDQEADFVLSNPVESRSQGRPQLFCPAGAIIMAKCREFKINPTVYGPGHKFFPVSWKEGFDIDTPEDIEMGELLLKIK